jgi:hypothetical protein
MLRERCEMASQTGKGAGNAVKSSQHPVSKPAILSRQACDFVTSQKQKGPRSVRIELTWEKPTWAIFCATERRESQEQSHAANPAGILPARMR